MNIKELVADDDAVSPVIGVILMVAITVILAAVIGTFVLGIGQDQQTTPSATFDFEWDYDSGTPANSQLTITHTGGDSFTSENTNSLTVSSSGGGISGTDFNGGSLGVTAGTTFTNTGDISGETVRIVWEAPGGGKTQTVGSFDVPNP